MQADWKASLAAMHRDVLHGESPWRPLRQSVSVAESVDGRWWKLALAALPVVLFLGLLWRASQPPRVEAQHRSQRFEVVFIPRSASATEHDPPPPAPPRLHRPHSLIAAPVPEPPRAIDYPDEPALAEDAAEDSLPPPSGTDLLRQIDNSVRRQVDANAQPFATRAPPRLPGRSDAFVEGIHVRGRPSPEQRVQFVLGLVGLGRPDPCPDVRRHVRDAIAAEHRGQGIDGELQLWLTRAEKCRR